MNDVINSLAGASVVITRPVGSAATLRRRVLALGGVALSLPGLSLRLPVDEAAARGALKQVGRADDWIFMSPAAVRFTFSLVPHLRIPHRVRVFALGTGTARAVASHSIIAIAPSKNQNSEGLLALTELKSSVRGRQIVLIGAPGGREVVHSTLQKRGAKVDMLHVYRRVAPRLTQRHFSVLEAASTPLIMLISSGEALANLVAMLPPTLLERMQAQPIVVSSGRLLAQARAQGFTKITVATSALSDDLLAAAVQVLTRHRL